MLDTLNKITYERTTGRGAARNSGVPAAFGGWFLSLVFGRIPAAIPAGVSLALSVSAGIPVVACVTGCTESYVLAYNELTEPLPPCPEFEEGVVAGQRSYDDMIELSGLAVSRANPGFMWVHNDSGDEARVFALSIEGSERHQYKLAGVEAIDFEDIAVGPAPYAGAPADPSSPNNYIFIADTGNDDLERNEVQIYRIAEPLIETHGSGDDAPDATTDTGFASTTIVNDVKRFDVIYPNRRYNSDTIMVDPSNGDLYIVTAEIGGSATVFRLTFAEDDIIDAIEEIVRFGKLSSKNDWGASGGDISPSGNEIIVRTHLEALLWRVPATGIAQAFETDSCLIPLENEYQGEAIGFALDESGYYTLSENPYWYTSRALRATPTYFFKREAK